MSESKTAARRAAQDAAEAQSWDDFWAEVQRERAAEVDAGTIETETICGVEVPVPFDLPLALTQRAEALSVGVVDDEKAETALRTLVAEVFGADVLDQWLANGLTTIGFQVALAWGVACGSGARVTFRQAYEAVKTAGEGQAPSRAQRRATTRSARSGGRSKPTSAASTG